MTVLAAARADNGATWRIVSGSAGSFLEPPGSPLFDWEIIEGTTANPLSIMALTSVVDDETASWIPEPIRVAAKKLLDEATYRRSDLWERHVYSYFRGCYSPDGAERKADRLLIVGMDEPLYPGHPLVESGQVKLSEYPSLNKGPKVTADDPRIKPEHHAAFLLVRRYFPDAEPRLDLIDLGSRNDYGTKPCLKCGGTVQYEARFDAYAVFGETSAACPKGGTHDVSTHRHTFSGQTLVHDHPHDGPHGYFGHPEDPTPHEPSDTTGTYELGGESHAHD